MAESNTSRLSEFDLIEHYFSKISIDRDDVELGIGDDAAIININPNEQLVTSVDTLVDGVHFPVDAPPSSVAHRSIACNLSDMAAMGAKPKWCLLSLSLPHSDSTSNHFRTINNAWLEAFCEKFSSLLKNSDVSLVGGDTTSSSLLSITITMMGVVPKGLAMRRDGAEPGDDIYVSGFLGEASLGLDSYRQGLDLEQRIQQRFLFPDARVKLGLDLLNVANSCIDISDGLLAEAQHIATRSNQHLHIELDKMLISKTLKELDLDAKVLLEKVMSGGDDYELLFTVPKSLRSETIRLSDKHGIPLTRIGCVVLADNQTPKVICFNDQGDEVVFEKNGYEHQVHTC